MRSWSTFKASNKWESIPNKPTILTDNQISWDEVINKPSIFPPAYLEDDRININLGTNVNSYSLPSAIEIPSENLYGGFYDFHSGILLGCGDHNGWGTQNFKIYIASNWGTYNSNPCLSVGNYSLVHSGTITASGFIGENIPDNPIPLAPGSFWRDTGGYLRIV